MRWRQWPDRFQIAFSLAGQHRPIIEPLARELENTLGRSTVFYDEWFEPIIQGVDSLHKLEQLYHDKCDLVIVCVSGQYQDKIWPKLEHHAIRARLFDVDPIRKESLVYVRVGDGDVDGIMPSDIVPDFRVKTIDEQRDWILQRLEWVTRGSEETLPGALTWTATTPAFKWPMADQARVRSAYAELVLESSPHRILLVEGPSETGKSRMAEQMLESLVSMPSVRSGSLDLKGGAPQLWEKLESLCHALDVDLPPSSDRLSTQLGAILTQLKRRPNPTVLVIDTYEAAGEVGSWVERVLLPLACRSPWLRVIVLGQSVPSGTEMHWAPTAIGPINLTRPSVEDWFEFWQERDPDKADLVFLRRAYDLCGGKPSTLFGLVGGSPVGRSG